MISVGLDISSKNITIVEVVQNRKGMAIRNAVDFEIPADSIKNGELQDPVVLAKGLKEAWRKFIKFSPVSTIFSIFDLEFS